MDSESQYKSYVVSANKQMLQLEKVKVIHLDLNTFY